MKEEEIVKMLREKAEEIEIPQSLATENMMKRLQQAAEQTEQQETRQKEQLAMEQTKQQEEQLAMQQTDQQNVQQLAGQQAPEQWTQEQQVDEQWTKEQRTQKQTHKKKWLSRGLITGGSLIAASAAIFFGARYFGDNAPKKNDLTSQIQKQKDDDKKQEKFLQAGEGSGNVKAAASKEEIMQALLDAKKEKYSRSKGGLYTSFDAVEGDMAMNTVGSAERDDMSQEAVGAAPGEGYPSETKYGGAEDEQDYYKNNDQVAGVKEPDTVLTDGKNIYSVYKDHTIEITTVNGEDMQVASVISLEDDVNNWFAASAEDDDDQRERSLSDTKLYINKDKLLATVNMYDRKYLFGDEEEAGDWYFYNDDDYSVVLQYDLANLLAPELQDVHWIDGYAEDSRMVGDYLYVMTEKDLYNVLYGVDDMEDAVKVEDALLPAVDGEQLNCQDIYIAEEKDDLDNYAVLTAFAIGGDGLTLTDSSAVLSSGNELYVSNENIYAFSVYGNYENNAYVNEDGVKMQHYETNTTIYKFAYGDGSIQPKAVGMVKGTLLNQFSLDEYEGYLRLVSTVYESDCVDYDEYYNDDNLIEELYRFFGLDVNTTEDDEWQLLWELEDRYDAYKEFNALYILDENLNTCGSIENIAEDEHIYSARFSGDRGYFVTFRQMDPLFIADLSDVNQPAIIGELEMTGYSGYLHKWSDDTLLGIGVEATEGGRAIGMKVALYDISEDEALHEITQKVLEGKNTYDYYNYKDMMVAPERSLVGLNLSWYEEGEWEDSYQFKNMYYLFAVSEDGINDVFVYDSSDYFEHDDDKDDFYYYYNYYNDNQCRGIYIGDYLYIVSTDQGISAVSLADYSVKNTISFR